MSNSLHLMVCKVKEMSIPCITEVGRNGAAGFIIIIFASIFRCYVILQFRIGFYINKNIMHNPTIVILLICNVHTKTRRCPMYSWD